MSGKVSLDIFDLVSHAGTFFHVLIMNVIEEEKILVEWGGFAQSL